MICAIEDCNSQTKHGSKTKYCRKHQGEARRQWTDRIDKEKKERIKRYKMFEIGWEEAVSAAADCWQQIHAHSIDNNHLDTGVAHIVVTPATSSFAKWLKKNDIGLRGLPNGWHVCHQTIIPWDEDELYYPKEAAVRVVAAVLNDMLSEYDSKTTIRAEAHKYNGNNK